MKIWISDNETKTHRNVRLNCEDHSGYVFLGDLNDEELSAFLFSVQKDLDVEKNVKLLKYYGYLHLFVINKNDRLETES